MSHLFSAARFHGVRITAARGMTPRSMTEDGRLATDPHAWQDPRNSALYAAEIAGGLARGRPWGRRSWARRRIPSAGSPLRRGYPRTDPRIATMLARETGVGLGGTVYSDALPPPGGAAPTYLAMLRHSTALFSKGMMPL